MGGYQKVNVLSAILAASLLWVACARPTGKGIALFTDGMATDRLSMIDEESTPSHGFAIVPEPVRPSSPPLIYTPESPRQLQLPQEEPEHLEMAPSEQREQLLGQLTNEEEVPEEQVEPSYRSYPVESVPDEDELQTEPDETKRSGDDALMESPSPRSSTETNEISGRAMTDDTPPLRQGSQNRENTLSFDQRTADRRTASELAELNARIRTLELVVLTQLAANASPEPASDAPPDIGQPLDTAEVRALRDSISMLNLQLRRYKSIATLKLDSVRVTDPMVSDAYLAEMRAQHDSLTAAIAQMERLTAANRRRSDTLVVARVDTVYVPVEAPKTLTTPIADTLRFTAFYERSALQPRNKIDFDQWLLARLPHVQTATIYLTSQTDRSGSAEANLRISQLRNEFIMNHLVEQGFNRSRIYKQALGSANASDSIVDTERKVEVTFVIEKE
jgi:hypothetical protein